MRRTDKRNITWIISIVVVSLFVGYEMGYFIQMKTKCYNGATLWRRYLQVTQPKAPGFLYIGIMSTVHNLNTRISASVSTWIKRYPGIKINVYCEKPPPRSSWWNNSNSGNVNLIHMQKVSDHEYPPQRKSFRMLKHFHDNHLEEFEWFLRLDDDAYVDVAKLERFLKRINSSRPLMIGSPGYGRDKFDLLPLGDNYCMGGTGVLFSRKMVRQIGSQLHHCIRNLYTEHEDVELGRCVQKFTGIKCTESRDTRNLFYQSYIKKGGYGRNIENMPAYHFDKGLIFHANKDEKFQLKFHLDHQKEEIKRKIAEIAKIQNELLIEGEDEEGRFSNIWSAMFMNGFVKTSPPWEVLSHAYKSAVNTVHKDLHLTRKTKVRQVYFKTDTSGVEYDVIFTRRKSRTSVKLRQNVLKDSVFFIEEGNVNVMGRAPEDIVHFIVALSGRAGNLKRFIESFAKKFLEKEEGVTLTIAYFSSNANQEEQNDIVYIMGILNPYERSFPNFKLNLFEIGKGISFSRGLGLTTGAKYIVDGRALLFFCDIDMVFDSNLLTKIRRNTIFGKQVYYPVFFSQFDNRSSTDFEINQDNGFWRSFSYGMVSIYNADFINTGGYNLDIEGWGLEDLQLLNAIQKIHLNVHKSNEEGLFHPFHDKFCSKSWTSEQYKSCLGSRAQHIASQHMLADRWLHNKRVAT